MLHKQDTLNDIIKSLEINDILNKPYLLSNNDYEILKEINKQHKGINIIARSIYLYDILELSDDKLVKKMRAYCSSKDYSIKELMLYKDCIKFHNSRTFFTFVLKFTRLKTIEDYEFYSFIAKRINRPIFVKSKDYNAVIDLIHSYIGTILLNSFTGKEIENIDEIKAFCENIYEFKIQNISIEYYTKIKDIDSAFKRVKTKRINRLKREWNIELRKLKKENPNVLNITKIKELDDIINNLI